MLNLIRQISNPLFKALSAGLLGVALVVIPATTMVILFGLKSEPAYQLIVYAALVSAAAGAIAGVLLSATASEASAQTVEQTSNQASNTDWKTWREFIVDRKVQESDSITSFYLRPADNSAIPGFIPGQFLTIQLTVPELPNSIIRTYSLSDYVDAARCYRLSIKREPAPPDTDFLPGISSNFMHDNVHAGSVILAKPPAGKFVLDVASSVPAVLISNGVGITPMISMAKAVTLLNPARHIWFLHGARDSGLHAFRDEINALAKQNPNLHVVYCYSRPTAADEGNYQHKGYADTDLIKGIIAAQISSIYGAVDAQYYLCGSATFMDSLRGGLNQWGVADDKVAFESFVKPKPKKPEKTEQAINESESSVEIRFSRSGKTLHWSATDGSILEFAEANGIYPTHGCRAGVCGTCMCKISAGAVNYDESPAASIDAGSVLICVCKPTSARLVLDI